MNHKNFQYLKAIFDRSEDGLMVCDVQGMILKRFVLWWLMIGIFL